MRRAAPLMIALDLSRLLSRAGRGTPTGIDRVELAYAEHLIADPAHSSFTALNARGTMGLLPRRAAEQFVAAIGAAWRGAVDPTPRGSPADGALESCHRRQQVP